MIFIFSGFTKITGYAATQGYMESMGVPGMLLPLVIAVELLEKLLRDEVKARMKNDVVQEKKYSDRILTTLNKYHNRSIGKRR